MAPGDDEAEEKSVVASVAESIKRIVNPKNKNATPAHYRNVLNNKTLVNARKARTNRLTSTDEGCYMTELDLKKLGDEAEEKEQHLNKMKKLEEEAWEDEYIQHRNKYYEHQDTLSSHGDGETAPLMDSPGFNYDSALDNNNNTQEKMSIVSDLPPLMPATSSDNPANNRRYSYMTKSQRTLASHYESDNFCETIKNILDRTLFQPPVVGALLGILCAITPARGWFVDLVNRHR